MGFFDKPLLKMVQQTNGYIVYRAPVCWKGNPPETYQVQGIVANQGVPPGDPFKIENCARVGASVVGEVVFVQTASGVVMDEWHRDVFHPNKRVKLSMLFSGGSSATLEVDCLCWAHETVSTFSPSSHEVATFNMALAALAVHQTVEAAKAVGSSEGAPSRRFSRRPVIASALAYPLRMLFRR